MEAWARGDIYLILLIDMPDGLKLWRVILHIHEAGTAGAAWEHRVCLVTIIESGSAELSLTADPRQHY